MGFVNRAFLALAVAVTAVISIEASAQAYPSKPVTLVAPFAAGGTSDTIARAVARLLEADIGQPVVVANRPGAGGTIGVGSVLTPPTDGHTVVLGGLGSVVFPTVVYKGRIRYDAGRDLVPVGVIGSAPTVIAVRAGLAAKTLPELVALAKANPQKLSFASAGIGGTLHVAGVLLEREAGVNLNHVPYKGGAPAMTDLAAGTVDIALADLTLLKPLIATGRIRPIAIASGERSNLLPNVPTTTEAGLAQVRMDTWYAVFAPATTPVPALVRLKDAVAKMQGSTDLVAVLQAQGITPLTTPLHAFELQLKRDYELWPPLLTRICSQSSCD